MEKSSEKYATAINAINSRLEILAAEQASSGDIADDANEEDEPDKDEEENDIIDANHMSDKQCHSPNNI